jgi:hypothetical protein
MKFFRITSFIFWVLAAGFFVAGMATAFWPKVEGTLLYAAERGYMTGGYSTRWASRGGAINLQSVAYLYSYADTSYEGAQACFCLPIAAINPAPPGTRVPVYVFPLYPRLSVLRQGPDFILVLALAVAGWASWQFARMVQDYLLRLYERSRERISKDR